MSDLVGNPEARFSRVAAHVMIPPTFFCGVRLSAMVQHRRAWSSVVTSMFSEIADTVMFVYRMFDADTVMFVYRMFDADTVMFVYRMFDADTVMFVYRMFDADTVMFVYRMFYAFICQGDIISI